ncbi:MAG: Gfo/Idh/MocA family oxidoreductase, partial [Clostridium sp.]|nr:Gfo/Idh/MocA family oxidoreductase [Clostridium sp.]
MDRKVRWGILGYAGIARNHVIPAMAKAENAELSAIASRSRDKLKEAVAQFGFRKVYESYDRLLEDPEIDAVYIPLPNALHKEWAVKAARHGKHVLCEKPLALTEADCRELEAVFKENHVKLMEAFMYRFLSGIRALKEALEQGAVGEIRHIYSTHRFYL